MFKIPLDLQLGRFEYNLNNQRLIGAVGWHYVGRSFDGAHLAVKFDKVKLELFGYNVRENFLAKDSLDNIFSGFIAGFDFGSHDLDVHFLNENIYKSDALSRFTTGFHLKGKLGRFYHTAEF